MKIDTPGLDTNHMKAAHPRLSLPWAIKPDALQRIAAFDPAKCEAHPDLADISEEDFEERLEMDAQSGVAVLRIGGPLVIRPELWERYFYGAACLERLEALIRTAEADSNIRALVLAIDSPGGTVTGTPEVGAAVADFARSKPIAAFTNSLMASAAYWIGSQVGPGNLYSTASARVGSVGVLRPHVDYSELYKREGINVKVFTSGKFKAAGAYGTALTDEQDAQIQAEVDALGAQFRETVNNARPGLIDPAALEGQVLYGRDAITAGLIDAVIPNSSALFAMVREKASRGVDNFSMSMNQPAPAATGDEAPKEAGAHTEGAASEAPKSEAQAPELAKGDESAGAPAGELANGGESTPEGANGEATPAPAAEGALAMIRDLSAENATLKADNASLRERIAALEASAKTVEERAAEVAANIAAQSGAEPVNVTPAGDGATAMDNKTTAELYAELDSIKGKDARETAELQRAFYLAHIKPRQR